MAKMAVASATWRRWRRNATAYVFVKKEITLLGLWFSRTSSFAQCGLRFSSQRVEIMVDSFEQLKIDTPEQIALELPLAGIGSRFLAIAIDTLIQGALYLITGLIFLLLLPEGFSMFTFLPKTLGPGMAIFIGCCIK